MQRQICLTILKIILFKHLLYYILYTVLGSISLSKLGKTLTHEHLALDFRNFYVSPPKHIDKHFPKSLHLADIGYIRQYP